MSDLTHINEHGEARMVDVGSKSITQRSATARSELLVNQDIVDAMTNGTVPKGDVIATARIAGIQAAKKCSDLIPLCHPLMLSSVEVDIQLHAQAKRIRIEATCKLADKTGVEMEALTAASIAALTLYDMCKAIDKGMVISETRLVRKTGGKSGDWHYDEHNG